MGHQSSTCIYIYIFISSRIFLSSLHQNIRQENIYTSSIFFKIFLQKQQNKKYSNRTLCMGQAWDLHKYLMFFNEMCVEFYYVLWRSFLSCRMKISIFAKKLLLCRLVGDQKIFWWNISKVIHFLSEMQKFVMIHHGDNSGNYLTFYCVFHFLQWINIWMTPRERRYENGSF